MNADELTVAHAALVVKLRTQLRQAAFICKEHLNDFSTMFMVTHADSPGWKVKVTLRIAPVNRNRVDVDGACVNPGLVLERVTEHRRAYDAKLAQSLATEATYRHWQQQQQTELAGLPEIRGVDVQIIPGSGRYAVTFTAGHPLEQLTLKQFKAFHAFLWILSRS